VASATNVMNKAKPNRKLLVVGRAGMVAYGAVHILVAYLAIRVAAGSGQQQADQKGALEEISSTALGGVILWVVGIGLILFGLWQVTLAATGYKWRDKKRTRVLKRIGAVVRAVTGFSIGVLAIRMAMGGDSGQSSNQKEQTFTAKLLELPAGKLLVAAVALTVIGFGIGGIVSGFRRSFMKDLDTTELPAGTERWVRRIGAVGYPAKGVAIAIVGILLGIAAIQEDPGKAGGLDAALRTLADQPFGAILLSVVAIGFAAFGVFCFAAARSHRT
jgi:hypothetical protein